MPRISKLVGAMPGAHWGKRYQILPSTSWASYLAGLRIKYRKITKALGKVVQNLQVAKTEKIWYFCQHLC